MSVGERLGSDPMCRRTLDHLASLVRLWSPEQGVVFVNRAWCDLTGTTLDENLGDGWLRTVHDADRATVLLALASAPPAAKTEYRLQTGDGRTVPVIDSWSEWTEEHAPGATGVVHTVTVREVVEPGGQPMSKWAHELRGPLNAILGWSDLLGSGDNDPEVVQRGLKAIANNARQQASIIKRMTD
jgi:PAS domain S-box-containing protein